MSDEETLPAEGPLRTVLEQADVRNLRDLAAKPMDELMVDLDRLTIPPSEAILGALVLHAVDGLREATRQLDEGSRSMLRLTFCLLVVAALALGASVVTLLVAS